MKTRKSAYYFRPAQCNECNCNDGLFMHKYTDEILCEDCVDARLRDEEEASSEENIVSE